MKKIVENIYKDILELSNLDFQRKLWLNENNSTGQISSYKELMNRLFDDDNFDVFIANVASDIGIDSNLILELDILRELLNRYEEKETDKEIINDPNWVKISEKAKFIIKNWRVDL